MIQNLQVEGQKEVLYTSTAWNNGKERKLYGYEEKDPYDSKVMLSGDSGRRLFINGKGTAFLSDHKARIYIEVPSYNTMMQLTYTHNETLEYLSLRMRRLRYGDRFEGYGLHIYRDRIEAILQSNEDGKVNIGNQELEKEIPNDKIVTVRWWVRDVGNKIEVKSWIKYDENGEFEDVFKEFSENYPDLARDKDEFHRYGIAWIRVNNNRTEHVEDVPIKDVYIIELE